jgi:hypothetical protein
MSEIDSDSSVFSQGFMFAHLTALVKGHGKAHLAFKAFENLGKTKAGASRRSPTKGRCMIQCRVCFGGLGL